LGRRWDPRRLPRWCLGEVGEEAPDARVSRRIRSPGVSECPGLRSLSAPRPENLPLLGEGCAERECCCPRDLSRDCCGGGPAPRFAHLRKENPVDFSDPAPPAFWASAACAMGRTRFFLLWFHWRWGVRLLGSTASAFRTDCRSSFPSWVLVEDSESVSSGITCLDTLRRRRRRTSPAVASRTTKRPPAAYTAGPGTAGSPKNPPSDPPPPPLGTYAVGAVVGAVDGRVKATWISCTRAWMRWIVLFNTTNSGAAVRHRAR